MKRRQFIEGLLAGAALGGPGMGVGVGVGMGPGSGLAMARQPASGSALCIVSSATRADGVAAIIARSGVRVMRMAEEPGTLWYEYVAPALDEGRAIDIVVGGGAGFMLGKLAHLRGHIAPSALHSRLAQRAGMGAWQVRPRLPRGLRGHA